MAQELPISGWMRYLFFHSLGFRVLVGSVTLLLVLFACYSYFTVRFYNDKMMDQVFASANRMGDVIVQSPRYSMFLNPKDDVYQIITTIGREPGVEGIRLYNKKGEIIFSTDGGDDLINVILAV